MKKTLKPRIKICCIGSLEEASLAIKYGAAALGLVGEMPSGPGVIGDKLIKEIARFIPPGVSSFLLTSKTSASGIIEHYRKVNTSTIQIVDQLKTGTYDQIRQALPNVKLVQVVHVFDERSVEEAIRVSDSVDAILLDSGNPNLIVKELGGTGRVHNWNLSRLIREEISIPLFLAGGIDKGNVEDAIEKVQPYGLDLCSSVRNHGKLDESRLKEFFSIIDNYNKT
jgi:phosphoribosylanthranilate isomerase